MLFGSFRFLLGFLPVTLIAFYALGRRRVAVPSLAAASFVFHCWGDPLRNALVLSASTAAN